MQHAPVLALIVLLGPTTIRAQVDPSNGAGQRATLLWVPALWGAVTLDAGLCGRFPRLLAQPAHDLPTQLFQANVGYLHYLDGHGRGAVGGYVGAAFSLPEDLPGPRITRVDFGAAARLRGISPDFFHFTLAGFAEVGLLVVQDRPVDPLGGAVPADAAGVRWAAGVETGPGLLYHLDPFLFAEVVGRLGVEAVHLEGLTTWSIIGGLRVVFDFTVRGRPPEPDE